MIYTKEDFIKVRQGLREKNRKVVFTNGCFDIIHRGHVEYLYEAQSLGDYLVVGLNSDDSVRRLKGETRPLQNQGDRAYVLDSLKCVEAVIIFGEDTPYELIKSVLPDFLVKGSDYRTDEIAGHQTVIAHGGKVETIDLIMGFSTTSLIHKIKLMGT